MAMTPRSVLRSPLTLLALLISGLIAAAGTLLFLGTWMWSCSEPESIVARHDAWADECQEAAPVLDEARWDEIDFHRMIACYDGVRELEAAKHTADRGLMYFPRSEALYNAKAYYQMELGEYEAAIGTLRSALDVLTPTTGTLENNLAWAGLYQPRTVTTEEARALYLSSLAKSPSSCETIHTGMWVEYAMAMQTSGAKRTQAILRYQRLAKTYDGVCEGRSQASTDLNVERLGAGVLAVEMARLNAGDAPSMRLNYAAELDLIRQSRTRAMHDVRTAGLSDAEVCELSTPIASAQHACEALVASARQQQVPQQERTGCMGGGGLPAAALH